MSKNRERENCRQEKIDISDCDCPQDTTRSRDQVTYRAHQRRKNERSLNHSTSNDKFPRNKSSSPAVKVTSAEGVKSWLRKDCGGWSREKSIRAEFSNISSSPSPIRNPQKYNLKSDNEEIPCNGCECLNIEKNSRTSSPGISETPGSYSSRPQKLCELLKTREARKIIGCTCDNEDTRRTCSVSCCCPESPVELSPGTQNSKINENINISNCKSDICSCFSDNYAPTAINLNDLQPEVPPPADWKDCGKYLESCSKEYRKLSEHLREIRRNIAAVKRPDAPFHKKITRRYPNKEFSFEIRSVDRKNCNNHTNNIKNESFFVEETIETVDRSCQATNSNKSSSKSRGKKVFQAQCRCSRDFHSIGREKRGKSLPRERGDDFNGRKNLEDIFSRNSPNNSRKTSFCCKKTNVSPKKTRNSNFYNKCPDICEYSEKFIEKPRKYNARRRNNEYPCDQCNYLKKMGNSNGFRENEDYWDGKTKFVPKLRKSLFCDEENCEELNKPSIFDDCENCCRRKSDFNRKHRHSYFSDRNVNNSNFDCENPSCWDEKSGVDNKNINKIYSCDDTNCDVKNDEYSSDPVKYSSNTRKSRRKERRSRKKEREKRRHDFSLPRIVHTSKTRKDDDKMLIYPPEDKVGSPVSVYKTESFVNFCLEEIDDFGFQYDVTYVQKYRSSPWQPEDIDESEVNTECFSSDDYG